MERTKDCLKGYKIIDPYAPYERARDMLIASPLNRRALRYFSSEDPKIYSAVSILKCCAGSKGSDDWIVVEKVET
jgi:hypothetical protein